MDKKVELQVINITNSQAQIGAFAMLLGEVDGERQLPIIIGPAEASLHLQSETLDQFSDIFQRSPFLLLIPMLLQRNLYQFLFRHLFPSLL